MHAQAVAGGAYNTGWHARGLMCPLGRPRAAGRRLPVGLIPASNHTIHGPSTPRTRSWSTLLRRKMDFKLPASLPPQVAEAIQTFVAFAQANPVAGAVSAGYGAPPGACGLAQRLARASEHGPCAFLAAVWTPVALAQLPGAPRPPTDFLPHPFDRPSAALSSLPPTPTPARSSSPPAPCTPRCSCCAPSWGCVSLGPRADDARSRVSRRSDAAFQWAG